MPIKVNSYLSSRFLDTRVVLLLLSFIAIVCFASAISISKEYKYSREYGPQYPNPEPSTEWTDDIGLSSVFASFAWTVFVLLRPIHNCLAYPGYSVGFDCFSWVYLTISCISGASFSNYLRAGDKDHDSAKAGTIRNLEIVAYLCAFTMVLIHFILFVFACQATHTRNREILVEEIITAIERHHCLGPIGLHARNSSHTSVSVPCVLEV